MFLCLCSLGERLLLRQRRIRGRVFQPRRAYFQQPTSTRHASAKQEIVLACYISIYGIVRLRSVNVLLLGQTFSTTNTPTMASHSQSLFKPPSPPPPTRCVSFNPPPRSFHLSDPLDPYGHPLWPSFVTNYPASSSIFIPSSQDDHIWHAFVPRGQFRRHQRVRVLRPLRSYETLHSLHSP